MDLKKERLLALHALLNANYIPSGMEVFTAADEDLFEYIKRVIDICDYYLLIVCGRYGSIASDGRSYTEKEFDYARNKGIKVIALVHSDPYSLPEGMFETDPERKDKFDRFRRKVCEQCVVKMWSKPEEIPEHILAGLKYATEQYPAYGWIRNDASLLNDKITIRFTFDDIIWHESRISYRKIFTQLIDIVVKNANIEFIKTELKIFVRNELSIINSFVFDNVGYDGDFILEILNFFHKNDLIKIDGNNPRYVSITDTGRRFSSIISNC